jgi:2-keto-4-pentenoate hydratase/2-oxohepta-3-ene-1,7-dioic acid hydratase in catechol pathway
MRIANVSGRAALLTGNEGREQVVDIDVASQGRFGPGPAEIYEYWDKTSDNGLMTSLAAPLNRAKLGPPSPNPRQVFAVGLNYHDHAAESGMQAPTGLPPVFTKYTSSFSGPDSEVSLPAGGKVDWEVELVVIVGRSATEISTDAAWNYVAGLTVGQDISERTTQLRGPAPQFGLGKSFPGFSPQGPWLVTPEEFADPDDLELGCTIDGAEVQKGRTRDLIFSVPRLISHLSSIVTLHPGDVVFTGTPAGVGLGRSPQRFLQPGETLDSWIEGIGELHQRFVQGSAAIDTHQDEQGGQ